MWGFFNVIIHVWKSENNSVGSSPLLPSCGFQGSNRGCKKLLYPLSHLTDP